MKKNFWIGLFVALTTSVAMAQPPEEVPPPPPETEAMDQAAPAAEPVAEVKAPAPSAPPEDKRVKGVEISPGVAVYPIGYDNNVSVSGSEGQRWFFDLKPSIGISSSFKTSMDRTLDVSAGYSLDWREYYNKDVTSRDFLNEVTGSLGIQWTPMFSTKAAVVFDYFFKTGADANNDNNFFLDIQPVMNFKVNDQLSLKLGYQGAILTNVTQWVGPDGQTSYSNPPDDIDDLRRGSLTSDATGFDNWDPTQFGLYPDSQALTAATDKENAWFMNNRAVAGVTYKFPTGTTVAFTYKYDFRYISNVQDANATAHIMSPSITQQLPWKGGSVTLINENRIRKYQYATVSGTDGTPKQDARVRFILTGSQDINDYIGFEAYYQLDLNGKNETDYSKWAKATLFYMGVNFKF